MTSQRPYGGADTTRTPLTRWPQEVARATALAYRKAAGEGLLGIDRFRPARDAFMAAGGDPAEAPSAVMEIVAAAARDHGEWFWRPSRLRVEAEERYWRGRGIWPPPMGRSLTPKILPE
jgi:hypothetical protein